MKTYDPATSVRPRRCPAACGRPVRRPPSSRRRRRRPTRWPPSARPSITLEQVDQKALDEPASSFGSLKLSQAIYEARRAAADELVGNMLLDQEAKRRSVERDRARTSRKSPSKVKAVTEAEIAAWYQANPQRVQGATLDQVRAPIQSMLTQQRIQAARDAYHRDAESEDAGARHDPAAARDGDRREQPGEGLGLGADRAHRVRRLRVPVLPRRRRPR